jgi:hypothetical protein
MLGQKIVEGQQHLPVLRQAIRRFGILAFVGQQVKGERCTGFVWSHPDGLEALFGLGLHALGEFVQDIGRFVDQHRWWRVAP